MLRLPVASSRGSIVLGRNLQASYTCCVISKSQKSKRRNTSYRSILSAETMQFIIISCSSVSSSINLSPSVMLCSSLQSSCTIIRCKCVTCIMLLEKNTQQTLLQMSKLLQGLGQGYVNQISTANLQRASIASNPIRAVSQLRKQYVTSVCPQAVIELILGVLYSLYRGSCQINACKRAQDDFYFSANFQDQLIASSLTCRSIVLFS